MLRKNDLPSPQLELVEHGAGDVVVLTDKIKLSLYKKSKSSGFDTDTLEEVYLRGLESFYSLYESVEITETPEQYAFNRVNSFIAGGAAADMDRDLQEKRGLWDNIHAKQNRIKRGSREHMRQPGSKGAPTDADFKAASEEVISEISPELIGKVNKARALGPKQSKTSAGNETRDRAVRKVQLAIGRKTSEAQSKNSDDPSSRFVGTESLVNIYKKDTPGYVDTIKKAVHESAEKSECENGTCPCMVSEAKFQGREVPLNKPMKGDVKKSKVFVKDPSTGNVKKVNFGDKTLSIKKNQPARKRSYCARSSGQGNLTDKTKANYWSRRAWEC